MANVPEIHDNRLGFTYEEAERGEVNLRILLLI